LVSKPSFDMADQRFDRIERELKELGSMEERMTRRMEEMMATFAVKLQGEGQGNSAGSSRSWAGKDPIRTESGNSFPKVAKLNFPKYEGTEDPTSWVCRAEQFFDFQNTAEEDKVVLAAYHLEGEAQLWYQLFKETEGASWENLQKGLHIRYGPTQFDDFFGDLTKLQQTGTVRDYQGQYEWLLSRAGRLSVAQQVGGLVRATSWKSRFPAPPPSWQQ
jgi:hypothetical protein